MQAERHGAERLAAARRVAQDKEHVGRFRSARECEAETLPACIAAAERQHLVEVEARGCRRARPVHHARLKGWLVAAQNAPRLDAHREGAGRVRVARERPGRRQLDLLHADLDLGVRGRAAAEAVAAARAAETVDAAGLLRLPWRVAGRRRPCRGCDRHCVAAVLTHGLEGVDGAARAHAQPAKVALLDVDDAQAARRLLLDAVGLEHLQVDHGLAERLAGGAVAHDKVEVGALARPVERLGERLPRAAAAREREGVREVEAHR